MEMVTMATEYQSIPVGLIAVDGKNPRRTFDEDGLAELAASMRQVGIVEPLVLRRGGDSGYLLVAGERRLRAAKLAELAEVPCVIRDYDERQAREVQLVENLQRKNVTGIEEAQGFRELMDDYGYSAEQLADRVGKKARVIYQRLALLKLPEPVKEAMGNGKLTTNHAILIARAPAARQVELMRIATERGMSVRELDHHIKRTITLKLDAAPFNRADAELLPSAGSCDACPKRSGNAREMFPEISSPDVCTDRDCYDEKIVQHVNRALAANKKLVQIKISFGYWKQQPKHVLSNGQFKLIGNKKDRCDSMTAAICVFGERAGSQVDVCIDPKCKKHKPSSWGYERSAEDKARMRKEKLNLEVARVLRGRVVDAILDAGVPSGSKLLEAVAEALWDRLGHDCQRLVRKRHEEWDADILPIGDLPEEKLERLLIEFSLAGDLMVWSGSAGGVGDGLRARAEACGVDWKAIEKAVTAELSLSAAEKRRVAKCGGSEAEAAPVETKQQRKEPAGIESDNGVEIQLRAKAKGPVLAEIVLLRGPVQPKGKSRKAMGEPGWLADITVALKGEPKATDRVYADKEQQLAFESTTPALFAAYTRIGELAPGIGGDAALVRQWTERKLAALAS